MASDKKAVDSEELNEIVRRIVEVAKPEKIILFGSAAKGAMRPDSDLDLLVIKSGKFHRGRLTEEIHMNLFGVGQAVDVIVVSSEDVERYRHSYGLVIWPALEEGRIVYAGEKKISIRSRRWCSGVQPQVTEDADLLRQPLRHRRRSIGPHDLGRSSRRLASVGSSLR